MANILVDREGNRYNPPSKVQIGDVIYYGPEVHKKPEVIAYFGLREIDTTPYENKPADFAENSRFYYVTEEQNVPYFIYTRKSEEQIASMLIQEYIQILEAHYDAAAQERNYDNRVTCALRAGMVGSPFQPEGLAFGVWMDTCNATAYQILAEVKEGKRAAPSKEEFLALLPALVWPAPLAPA